MSKNDGAGLDPAKVTLSHPFTETNGINESCLSGPPPFPPLYCTPLTPHYSLSLSSWHTALTVTVSRHQILQRCNFKITASTLHIFISCFSSVSVPLPRLGFIKSFLIKPDIILEGKKMKLMGFVHKETKDNNKTYHGNGTWLDYFLQMYSQSGVRYCSL